MGYYKLYIKEEEFDRLNFHKQSDYLYCKVCGLFYNRKELQHGCNHGVDEGCS